MNRRTFIGGVVTCVAVVFGGVARAATAITVYLDPNCGCCHAWVEGLAQDGYWVKVEDVDDLTAIKTKFRIPAAMRGCDTAVIDGKYLEGHAPLETIGRMLREEPDIAGIAVPGMPSGSPGMGDDPEATYDVFAIPRGVGTHCVYLSVRPKKT